MGRFKSKLDVLRQTFRLCRLGGMPEPPWLDAFIRMNKIEELGEKKLGKTPKIRRLQFPEDRLIQSYYDRYPYARLQPIDLDTFDPPPVRKMAVRQQALIEQGVPRRRAQKQVEDEMLASGELVLPERPSVISQIQAEEERVLMAAIQQRKQAGTRT